MFFSSDDNSDAERLEKQRRNLDCIREAAAKDLPRTAEHDDANDSAEELSEEGELRMLRSNTRYQQYAAKRKRGPFKSLVAKRSRSPDRRSEEGGVTGRSDVDILVPVQTACAGGNTKQLPFVGRGRAYPEKEDDSSEELRRAKAGPTQKGPTIDPKIIDDSSDDDSASDSSSDAPIGPLLPKEILRKDLEALLDDLPIQNESTLGDSHSSHVSSITIERAGNRLVTGSIDSTVKLWDFHAMNRSLQSFKTVSPFDEGPVHGLEFSHTGALLLCTGTGNAAVVMDRDGHVLSETGKGDMYIVDMARTTGHAGRVHSAKWRPGVDGAGKIIATISADATVRLWDVTRTSKKLMHDNPIISQLRVTKLRTARGGKAVATAMDWAPDGKSCILACTDGKIKVVDPAAFSTRPIDESNGFLLDGAETTSLVSAPPTSALPLVLVRSTDNFLRVFDRRSLKSPLKEFHDLPNVISETNSCFLGDGAKYFLTGTSANRKGGTSRGSLRMFHAETLCEVWKSCTDVDVGSVVCTAWHPVLNQIIYGSADGKIRVLYHPAESHRGVLNCLGRSDYRKIQGAVSTGVGDIYSASDIYQRRARGENSSISGGIGFRAESVSKRRRKDASEAMKPKPFSGPRVHQERASTTLAKHIAAAEVTREWSHDPREAILRYAEIAEKDPKFTNAYRLTQPKTLLAEKTAEQEEEETREAIYARDLLRKRKE